MKLTVDGEPVDDLPLDVLPDCEACDKVELDPSNYETVTFYSYVGNQQTFSVMSGERLGLRAEAVVSVLNELISQGIIHDRETVFRRVWILDEAVNKVKNVAIRAEAESAKAASKTK